jgi:hypothetical protein
MKQLQSTWDRRSVREDVCPHSFLKVRKHRTNPYPCLHCRMCTATWSDPIRALSYLQTKKELIGAAKRGA